MVKLRISCLARENPQSKPMQNPKLAGVSLMECLKSSAHVSDS